MLAKGRVLITGINGFTGAYVAQELSNVGYEVYGLGHQNSYQQNFYQVNLLDYNAVEKIINAIQPNVVIHLAAIAFVAHGNSDEFYQVNIIGTRNLLLALSRNETKLESVLIASSANVYGNQAEGKICELIKPNPSNDYAVSKLAMEYMAKTWSELLPITIARPFNYTGVGQSKQFLIPKIVSHFKTKEQTIELGNIDIWRDFNDVRNVANIYRKLVEIKPVGEIVNICTGTATSLREVIQIAENITNHKINIVVNPTYVRQNEVKILCGDSGKLAKLIGVHTTYSLHDTLQWMLQSKND